MQFVEHHALERAEQIGRIGGGEQQRQLLRRRHQDVRRIAALACALRDRRIAGARLDPDRQLHLGNRRFEIARDVDGERLQRRDVERVQAFASVRSVACRSKQFLAASRRARSISTSVGRNPASVLPPPVGAISSTDWSFARARQQLKLMHTRRPAARGEPARENRPEARTDVSRSGRAGPRFETMRQRGRQTAKPGRAR